MPSSQLLIKDLPKEPFTSYSPKASAALEKYCRLKSARKSEQFSTATERNIGYVIEQLGDRPFDTYSNADSESFRNWVIEKELTSTSIQRIFSTIRTEVNLTIYEDGLTFPNAYANTYLPSDERPKRASISPEDIKRVQKGCLDIADERRLIIALISDTGMRHSEA